MAQGRTAESETVAQAAPSEAVAEATGFGAEFRELARQRRFVRSEAPDAAHVAVPPATAAAPAAPAEPAAPAPAVPSWQSATAATPEPIPAPYRASQAPAPGRMSTDERAAITELARMSEKLVEAREALAAVSVRADRAEADVAAAHSRMMAARVLVQDAQRATRMSAERCAWLEGRCETLQEALDMAVNASFLARYRWRRRMKAAATI
ncbi:MAG: hypothetical protein JWM98_2835 [Thermoleophilia bacterium]|nr:hypothetical protein [Thermoleophilia bacterium]